MAVVTTIRMHEYTIDQVEKLKTMLHAPSFSDAIRRTIEIGDLIASAIKSGDKILIESHDGKQKQVLITGLNK
jgi:hypothetical protein